MKDVNIAEQLIAHTYHKIFYTFSLKIVSRYNFIKAKVFLSRIHLTYKEEEMSFKEDIGLKSNFNFYHSIR